MTWSLVHRPSMRRVESSYHWQTTAAGKTTSPCSCLLTVDHETRRQALEVRDIDTLLTEVTQIDSVAKTLGNDYCKILDLEDLTKSMPESRRVRRSICDEYLDPTIEDG